jgi:CRP-like cAMP-binding protein
MPTALPPANQLLASLPPADYEMLRPHLRITELTDASILAEAGKPIQSAYFPFSGIISLVVGLAGGETVDVATIGNDSAFGVAAALNSGVSMSNAVVRLPGTASILDVAHLRAAADESAPLRSVLIRHEETLFAQVQQYAACNAVHALDARLSRCLLRLRDLAGVDTLYATQELLAEMLGVQRNSVSIVANELQQANLIQYHRGVIEIVDPEGLRVRACECYHVVKMYYRRPSPAESNGEESTET